VKEEQIIFLTQKEAILLFLFQTQARKSASQGCLEKLAASLCLMKNVG
jgi:hypothetical protein